MRDALATARRLYRRLRTRHERRYEAEAARGRPLRMEEVDGVLDALGVGAGDRVMVHSHSAVLGQVPGGLMALIDRLKARVTPAGTLLMPAFPHRGSFWQYVKSDPTFDVRRTPSQMGLVTEVFRRCPGTTRSVHPTHSVSLWGADAEAWAASHADDPLPFHETSPYGHLYRHGGKVLFLELDGWHLTEVHVVEGLLRGELPGTAYIARPFHMKVVDWQKKSRRVPVLIHDPRRSSRIDVRHFYPALMRRGIVKRVRLRGYIPFVVVDAAPMVDYFVALARRGVSYYDATSAIGRLRSLMVRLESDAPPAGPLP